mgnify:CR=1 FL=1|jgi:hypothetical protein
MFVKYLHLERLDNPNVEGILHGTCRIEPKIDGTNSSVWIDNEGIHCGSRTRELNEEKDNAFFYSWMLSDNEEPKLIRSLLNDHPWLRLYGEWTGLNSFVGSIKDYNPEAKAHLYIFDVANLNNDLVSKEAWEPILVDYGLEPWIVPTLATIENPSIEDIEKIADNNIFLLDNANHAGEGVVIKNEKFRNYRGEYAIAKFVIDEYKQNKKRSKAVRAPGNVEQEIVERWVTDSELSKSVNKVLTLMNAEKFDNTNAQMVGRFIGMCWNDLIECAGEWVKKMKNPVVDFSALKGLCQQKARKYVGL